MTTRWGGGSRLIVGLAPAGAVPKSGLHALRIHGDTPLAAYLCGVFNSALFQDMASSMPPGQIRAQDIHALGMPDIGPAGRSQVASNALALADLVCSLVGRLGARFPQIGESLRADISLPTIPLGWVPSPGPSSSWGSLATVAWAEPSDLTGAQARPVNDVTYEDSILGPTVVAWHRSPTGDSRLTLALPGHPTDQEVRAVGAYLEGLRVSRVRLDRIGGCPVPTEVSALAAAHAADAAELGALAVEYRARRLRIEELLTP